MGCAVTVAAWPAKQRHVLSAMKRIITPLIQALSITSMSLAWLFCLGCLINLMAVLAERAPVFVATGVEAGALFGLQAGAGVLLEFDQWRAYYGVGALLRELLALAAVALASWALAWGWPGLGVAPTPGQAVWFWMMLLLVLVAPYLASQGVYLLLGEPLNFQRYLRCYYRRRWVEVVRMFEPLVQRHPRALRPQLILAAAYFNLRQFERARHIYERLLQRDPRAPGAWQGLAELDFTGGAWEAAVMHYEQALRFASFWRRGFIHVGLGIALYKLGRAEEAVPHLKVALGYPLSPIWQPIAAYTLMRAAHDAGDGPTAERALQRLALRRRARQQFMDYWQSILSSSSSPLNSDYRAVMNLVDQLSWGY